MNNGRPVVTRAAADPQVLAALSELDPISARVFAARGVADG